MEVDPELSDTLMHLSGTSSEPEYQMFAYRPFSFLVW